MDVRWCDKLVANCATN